MPNIDDYVPTPEEAKSQGERMGEMLAEGMGVGIDQHSYDAITATEGVYVKLETVTKNAAKNAENLAKKRQKRELDNLKNSLKLGLMSEQEYYTSLKKYRDENIAEGTDAWFECTEEIAFYNKKLMDEAAMVGGAYQKTVESVLEAEQEFKNVIEESKEIHDSFREKVISDLSTDSPLVNRQKITILNGGPDGKPLAYNVAEMNSFDSETKELQKYKEVIDELVKLGNIPQGVLNQIGDMEIPDAIATARIILDATPEERQKFIDSFNLRETVKGQVADALYPIFYADELREAGAQSANAFAEGFGQGQTFTKVLEESFEQVPESYYTLGETSAVSFGEGFGSQLEGIMSTFRNRIFSALNQMGTDALPFQLVRDTEGSTSNVFNTSYTFNASKDTTTTQLLTAKNAATLERLRGGI